MSKESIRIRFDNDGTSNLGGHLAFVVVEFENICDARRRNGSWKDDLGAKFHKRIDRDLPYHTPIPYHSTFVYVGKLG